MIGLALLLCGSPLLAHAGEPASLGDDATLSEAELIDAALQHDEFVALQDAELALAQAERVIVRRRLNPRVEYNREQVMSPRPQGEDYLLVAQTIDISGRRGLRTGAADRRIAATKQSLAGERAALVVQLRRAYASTLYAQERERLCEQWQANLVEALELARTRAGEGEGRAARLEVLRLEQELEQVEVELELVHDDRLAEWTELRTLALAAELPVEPPQLAGPLAPAPQGDQPLALPELRALELEVGAANLERDAARRVWVPGLTLIMGYKGVQMLPGRGNGFVAGFALIIPLVDVGRGDRLRAEAQLARAHAESSWMYARVEVAHQGLDARVDALTLDEDDASAIVELAEDAYRADEIEVGVLIDAQRAWLEGETAELDLALRARLARVELDRLEGRSP